MLKLGSRNAAAVAAMLLAGAVAGAMLLGCQQAAPGAAAVPKDTGATGNPDPDPEPEPEPPTAPTPTPEPLQRKAGMLSDNDVVCASDSASSISQLDLTKMHCKIPFPGMTSAVAISVTVAGVLLPAEYVFGGIRRAVIYSQAGMGEVTVTFDAVTGAWNLWVMQEYHDAHYSIAREALADAPRDVERLRRSATAVHARAAPANATRAGLSGATAAPASRLDRAAPGSRAAPASRLLETVQRATPFVPAWCGGTVKGCVNEAAAGRGATGAGAIWATGHRHPLPSRPTKWRRHHDDRLDGQRHREDCSSATGLCTSEVTRSPNRDNSTRR